MTMIKFGTVVSSFFTVSSSSFFVFFNRLRLLIQQILRQTSLWSAAFDRNQSNIPELLKITSPCDDVIVLNCDIKRLTQKSTASGLISCGNVVILIRLKPYIIIK